MRILVSKSALEPLLESAEAIPTTSAAWLLGAAASSSDPESPRFLVASTSRPSPLHPHLIPLFEPLDILLALCCPHFSAYAREKRRKAAQVADSLRLLLASPTAGPNPHPSLLRTSILGAVVISLAAEEAEGADGHPVEGEEGGEDPIGLLRMAYCIDSLTTRLPSDADATDRSVHQMLADAVVSPRTGGTWTVRRDR